MSVIPLSSVGALQATLFAYQQQMLQPHRALPVGDDAVITMLPFCTERPPLTEHATNVLSDLFHNFRDLAIAATTYDGQQEMRRWLGKPTPDQAEGVIAFWLQEYLID